MILPTRIVRVGIGIILLQKIYFLNLLRSCKIVDCLVRSITNLTTDERSRLDLIYLLGTYIPHFQLFLDFGNDSIFYTDSISF